MATITVRKKEYELIENEYGLLNVITLYLSLVDPKGSERFARRDVSLEELQAAIAQKYDEASESGKDAITSLTNNVIFALNLDSRLFPNVTNYRQLAHEYVKLLVPSAPKLDENLAGTEIAEFLLAISVPEALRKSTETNQTANENAIEPSTPKPRKSKKDKGFATNAPKSDDEATGALIDQLTSTSGTSTAVVDGSTTALDLETKVVDLESIAAIAPEIVEATDNYYAELLAEQQRNTVTILKKGEVAPPDLEEELGG